MTTDPAATRAAQAASFDAAADVYERARPGYPDEVVDWLLASRPREVLDLGAGTGKLTRSLVDRVATVHAVDPSPNMLAQLGAALPEVRTAVGTAEAVPLPDAAVEAVLVAQAWHWVDPERALPEVRRVLRPGGVLGLVWNVRDESVPWVARLTEIIHGSAAERFIAEGRGMPDGVGDVERLTWSWQRPVDRQGLLDLVASRSYMITAPPEVRADVLAQVSDLLDTHPDLAGRDRWELPYRTEAFRVALT
ncbi:class I SAM-dependent methyltransferase [Actinotalea caeni]|uniref:class I SAM-dependent methyltransferase n=1 Tax=Actinotalea caeni TaxID=1348467 RepID=UPI0012E26860|nr:class I SAM-dependent methyltransferase [Actinotalea caeni]